jgi:hypothetical protein
VKNITFSADADLIEQARAEARCRKTTLNALFREWLEDLARRDERRERVKAVFEEMGQYDAGGKFTREEMNER